MDKYQFLAALAVIAWLSLIAVLCVEQVQMDNNLKAVCMLSHDVRDCALWLK